MSKLVTVRKSENVPTNKIELSRYELRDGATEYEPRDLDNPFGQLVDSVKIYGILQPLQVVRRTPNQYEVVDGGRRLRAAKYLKLDHVPCTVLDISSESEIRKLAIIANLQRLDLTDIEKGHALVKLYTAEGNIVEGMATLRQLKEKTGAKPNLVFKRLADSISIPYHAQLDLIEIILGSNPEVQEKMERHKLATYKKRMVVQKELKQHPNIQKELVTRIKDAPARSAHRIVKQTVDDIKAGVYEKIKDNNYVLDYEKRKEAQAKEAQRLREPQHIYLDVMQDIGTLLNTMTNIAVQQLGPERIRSSKYATHMAKGLDDRQLSSLDNKLSKSSKVGTRKHEQSSTRRDRNQRADREIRRSLALLSDLTQRQTIDDLHKLIQGITDHLRVTKCKHCRDLLEQIFEHRAT